MDARNRLAVAVQHLRDEWPDLVAVYRFGSSGTPSERAESDIDLAILARIQLPAPRVWDVAQLVASVIGKNVDLVDLGRASTVMRARIVVDGERLYCSDLGACDTFEAHTLSDYARLNEERAGILQDIKERGSIYGG